jgi:hypothetical protein
MGRVLIGLGSLLLIGIVQQETVVSYLVVAGLIGLLVRSERILRSKERAKTRRARALLGEARNTGNR